MTQASERGPVEIQGVTTRTSGTWDRHCVSCGQSIHRGGQYERVARLDDKIESYHPDCFVDEFGERRLYEPREVRDA